MRNGKENVEKDAGYISAFVPEDSSLIIALRKICFRIAIYKMKVLQHVLSSGLVKLFGFQCLI